MADFPVVAGIFVGEERPYRDPRNEIPRIQRIKAPVSRLPKNTPARPAAAWLAMVATRIPKMTGAARWKRAASIIDRI